MSKIADMDLVELGRKAAELVPGLGTVERVKVTHRLDSTDRPAYYFSFLIERKGDREQAVQARIRLGQKLRDELLARDDDHYPYIKILNREDWEKREMWKTSERA